MAQVEDSKRLVGLMDMADKIFFDEPAGELSIFFNKTVYDLRDSKLSYCKMHGPKSGHPAVLSIDNNNDEAFKYYNINMLDISKKYKEKFTWRKRWDLSQVSI
ncbi:MAG: hypothetical protein PHV30_08475 [Candidatus Margulisbacteria bacterium]|nr:hypothetical protein [Candidatus Margulisiibacteriota bacterium]